MKPYLDKVLDWQRDDVTSQFDELPLWSAPFGLLLMEHVPMARYTHYLDVACGTGFPLIDLAQRLGPGCRAYGIDSWHAAVMRARAKIAIAGIGYIEVIEADAAEMPFPDAQFDLVTSNLGINNFNDPQAVLNECYRVMKPGASLCFTSNLTGTFAVFYELFRQTLEEMQLSAYLPQLDAHIAHRGTRESLRHSAEQAGFSVVKEVRSEYHMRFLDGSAFLNHAFIILGFIDSWRNMIEGQDKLRFFGQFEHKLNVYAAEQGELKLTVPVIYLECKK